MEKSVFIAKGILISSVAAGPIFVAVLGMEALYASLPKAVPVPGNGSGILMLFLIIPVVAFGFFAALLPNAVGAWLMGNLGRHFAFAQLAPIWAATGSLGVVSALALGGWFAEDQSTGLSALIITGAICALICRHYTRWAACAPDKSIRAPASVLPPAQSELGHRNTGARLLD
jgi:hypothetical protein